MVYRNGKARIAQAMLATFALTGCGSKSDSKKESTSTVALNFVAAGSSAGTALTDDVDAVGQASAGGLKSLKYFITSVTICQDAELNGSGFNSQSGCLDLYSFNFNDFPSDIYDTMDQTEAAKAKYDSYYKDLMQGLTFSGTVSKDNVGLYKYAFVNWMKPIKVTATVPLNDLAGRTLYTHPGTYKTVTENNFTSYRTLIEGMTTGPATEAITMLPNGGSVFSFFKPFEITSEDIANNTQYSIDLVFNPEGVVKGAGASVSAATMFDVDGNGDLNGPTMSVPFLSLIPLVHKSTEAVVKETYMIHFVPGMSGEAVTTGATIAPLATPFDVRLELYYLKDGSTITAGTEITSDLAEDVYGAHAEIVYVNNDTGKTQKAPNIPNIFSLAQNATSKAYSFYDWSGASSTGIITGFQRLEEVGATGTATMVCGDSGVGISEGGCYNSGENKHYDVKFTPTYELISRTDVVSLVKSTLETIVPYSIRISYDASISLHSGVCMPFKVDALKYETSGETVMAAPADIDVALRAEAGEIFADAACATATSSVKIAKGDESANFYVKAASAGTLTLGAQGSSAEKNSEISVTITAP